MPEVIRPKNNDEVTFHDKIETKILLQWKNTDHLKYELEWKNPEPKRATIMGGSAFVNVDVDSLLEWRVRIYDEKRPLAIWSPWQNVKITFVPLPVMPQELSPHEVEFQSYEKPNELIDLTWKGQAHVSLEIKTPSGSVISKKVHDGIFPFTATEGGQSSWRVRGIDTHFLKS
jgi:hypothetical protein